MGCEVQAQKIGDEGQRAFRTVPDGQIVRRPGDEAPAQAAGHRHRAGHVIGSRDQQPGFTRPGMNNRLRQQDILPGAARSVFVADARPAEAQALEHMAGHPRFGNAAGRGFSRAAAEQQARSRIARGQQARRDQGAAVRSDARNAACFQNLAAEAFAQHQDAIDMGGRGRRPGIAILKQAQRQSAHGDGEKDGAKGGAGERGGHGGTIAPHPQQRRQKDEPGQDMAGRQQEPGNLGQGEEVGHRTYCRKMPIVWAVPFSGVTPR